MDEFFGHETLSYPTALSKNQVQVPKVLAGVLEGSVLVNMLKPKKNQAFEGYCIDTVKLCNSKICC